MTLSAKAAMAAFVKALGLGALTMAAVPAEAAPANATLTVVHGIP